MVLLCEFQGCKRPFRTSWELLDHLQREHALELFSSAVAVTARAMPAAEAGVGELTCAAFGRSHSFSDTVRRAHKSSESCDSMPHSDPVGPLPLGIQSPSLSVGSEQLSPADSEKRGGSEPDAPARLLPIHVPLHDGGVRSDESLSPTAGGTGSGSSRFPSGDSARPMPRLKACEHCGDCFRCQQEFHAHRRTCAKRKTSAASDASTHSQLTESTERTTAACDESLLVAKSPSENGRKRSASSEQQAAESAKQSKLDTLQPIAPQQTPQFEEAAADTAPQSSQMLLALTALLMQQQALAQFAAAASLPNGSCDPRCPLPTTAALPLHLSEQKPQFCSSNAVATAAPNGHLFPANAQEGPRVGGHLYPPVAGVKTEKTESQALLENFCASTPSSSDAARSSSGSQSQGDSRIPSRQSAPEVKSNGGGLLPGALPGRLSSSLVNPLSGLSLGFAAADYKHLSGRHRGRERRSDTCEYCGKVFKVCSAVPVPAIRDSTHVSVESSH